MSGGGVTIEICRTRPVSTPSLPVLSPGSPTWAMTRWWLITIDSDGVEREEEEALARRGIRLGRAGRTHRAGHRNVAERRLNVR